MENQELCQFIYYCKTYHSYLLNNQVRVQKTDTGVRGVLCPSPKYSPVKCEKHFKYLNKDIRRDQTPIQFFNFSKVIDNFENLQLKSTDKKLFAVMGDTYLVKKYFTLGIQKSNQNEERNYSTRKYLNIYLPYDNTKVYPLRSFKPEYSSEFDCRTINSTELITIPANTFYIVIAPCNTIFQKQLVTIMEDESQNAQPSPIPGCSTWEEPSTFQEVEDSVELNAPSFHKNVKRRFLEDEGSPERSKTKSSKNKNSETVTSTLSPGADAETEIRSSVNANLEPDDNISVKTDAEIHDSSEQPYVYTTAAVFGIRKEHRIESYALSPGSSLQLVSNFKLTGEFQMENDDMDPKSLHYKVEDNKLVETAVFKNGSNFKTPLLISEELWNKLSNVEKGREKMIVNFFFDSVFEKIKATYENFERMRNTGVIGSCVPAIVQLDGSQFSGSLPDVYKSTS